MAIFSPAATGAGLALFAAGSWGAADFAGGMGVKSADGSTSGALRVVIAAHAMSLLVLLVTLLCLHAGWPSGAPLAWGLGAGGAAGLSLTTFYIALARGAMGASAAVSGLLAAAIPAAVSMALEGLPSVPRLVGFALTAVAIWLIAATPSSAITPAAKGTMSLAIVSGLGFGLYFVALRFANPLGVLEPMTLARIGSLATCLLLLALLRAPARQATTPAPMRRPWLGRAALLWALGVAVLDTGANLLFIGATRTGRLDVSAVLASLYPASTILLAAWLLHERPSRRQMLGMAIAVAAVVLITV